MAEVPPTPNLRAPVLAVSSNKGGVGKTTVATNLAVYLRALREDLPVLAIGLDDQKTLDRMFALAGPGGSGGNLKHGWAERDFSRVIQLGQYGVHFVPSPPDVALLKGRAENPETLRRILTRTAWRGIVLLDTKSDLEALTLNAFHAADRILIPVADWASLEEAAKIFRILERSRLGAERGHVVFTLVDRRTRGGEGGTTLFHAMLEEVRRREWPYYKTYISRSPRVEALNSATATPKSILHHARGTAVHAQMRELALEVIRDLDLPEPSRESRVTDPEPAVLWGRSQRPAQPQLARVFDIQRRS